MKPRWMRRHASCPDCGYIVEFPDYCAGSTLDKENNPIAFTCPRCKAHYSDQEFWKLNQDKYSTKSEV